MLPSSLSTRLLQLFFHVKSAEGFGEGLSSCVQPLLQLTLPANLVRFKLSHYEGITYRILMNDADILVLVCAVTVMRYVALLSFSVFQVDVICRGFLRASIIIFSNKLREDS